MKSFYIYGKRGAIIMIFLGVLLCQSVWSMETRKLGKMEVPKLGFGAMGISAFYDSILPDDKAITLLQRVIDLGMTFIDTSDIYGPFTNEEVTSVRRTYCDCH